MIDVEFDKLGTTDVDTISLLILEREIGHYCNETTQWADIIELIHPKSYRIDYYQIFRQRGLRGLQNYLLNFIDEHKINIVYFTFIFEAEFDLAFINRLREKVFLVSYFDDMALSFNSNQRYKAQALDLALSHDYVEKYRFLLYGTDCLFFPMFDPKTTAPEQNGKIYPKDIDISFVGRSDRFRRTELFDEIARHGLSLELFGAGTPNGIVTAAKKNEIFQRTKIGLNFSAQANDSRSQKIEKKIRQVKGRLWELAFSKAMIMTEHAPCLERTFKLGAELVVFDSPRDLIEKLRYYLDHDDKRNEIASNGYNRARRDFLPREACEKFLRLLYVKWGQKKYEPAELCYDRVFLSGLATQRLLHAIDFMRERKWRLFWEQFGWAIREGSLDILQISRELWGRVLNSNPRLKGLYRRVRGL